MFVCAKNGNPIFNRWYPSMELKRIRAPWSFRPLNREAPVAGAPSFADEPGSGFRRSRRAKPGPAAPRLDANEGAILAPRYGCQLTWIGHASFLLQLGTCNVLIDPVLSSRRIGKMKRYVEPGLSLEQLPPIHGLLITHEHPDHLDDWTVRRLPPTTHVIAPKGLASYFEQRRLSRVTELDWWQSTELAAADPVVVTLVPARHGSPGSGVFERAKALCGGFVVESSSHGIYHSGDTAFFDGFAELGARFPHLDAALLPVGAYEREEKGRRRHMTPEEAGRAFLQCGAHRLVPMHWGTFQLADEPLREGADRLRSWWYHAALGDDRRLTEMAVGETIGWD